MLAQFCRRISGWLIANGLPEQERAVYAYGLQIAIELAMNVISTLFIGFLFGCVPESLVFLIGYSTLRTYAGGFHAETAIGCYAASCGLVAGVLWFCRYFSETLCFAMLAATFLAAAVIFQFSPVPALHKPLEAEEIPFYRKQCHIRLYLELAVMFLLLFLGQGRLAAVLASGICLTAVFMVLGLFKNWKFQQAAKGSGCNQ